MKMIFYLIILVILSCNSEVDKIKTIYFQITQDGVSLKKDNLFRDCEVVKLESGKDIIIGGIDKVICIDNLIYVADYKKSRKLYIFDNKGNFKTKIDRYGKADNEYLDIANVYFDQSDNTINILSRISSKILKFDKMGNQLISVTKLDKMLVDIVPINNYLIGHAGNYSQETNHNLWKIDRQGVSQKSWIHIPKGWESRYNSAIHSLFKNDDGVLYYLMPHEQIIYKYSGDQFMPMLQLDFGQYNFPSNITSHKQLLDSNTMEFVSAIYDFYDSDDYWYFVALYQGQKRMFVYDKKSLLGKSYALENSRDRYFIGFGMPVNFTNNKFITYIESSELDYYTTGRNKYNNFSLEYESQIRNLNNVVGRYSKDDNPVLIIYDL